MEHFRLYILILFIVFIDSMEKKSLPGHDFLKVLSREQML